MLKVMKMLRMQLQKGKVCWCGSLGDVCQVRLIAWAASRRLFNKGTNLNLTWASSK
jgi:hypothetical protein